MLAQISLESKKQPWQIYIFLVGVLLFCFGTSAFSRMTGNRIFGYGIGNQVQWSNGTATEQLKLVKTRLQYDIHAAQRQSVQNQSEMVQVKLRSQKQILVALEHGNYEQVNKIVLQTEKRYPTFRKIDALILNGYSRSITTAPLSTYYSDKYLVSNHINSILDIAALSNVLNHFMAAVGYEPESGRSWIVLLPRIFIVVGALALMMIFFKDSGGKTEELMLVAPLKKQFQSIIRAVVTVVFLDLTIMCAFGIIILAMSFVPGHQFGDIKFPYTVLIMGKYTTYPVWIILAQYLLMVNLWFILLASIAFCMNSLVHNQLIGMAVTLLVTFARPLHLLTLLPPMATRFVPGYYTNFVQITLHHGEFADIKLLIVTSVFLVWTAVFWLIGSAVMTLRQHKYIPALA